MLALSCEGCAIAVLIEDADFVMNDVDRVRVADSVTRLGPEHVADELAPVGIPAFGLQPVECVHQCLG